MNYIFDYYQEIVKDGAARNLGLRSDQHQKFMETRQRWAKNVNDVRF